MGGRSGDGSGRCLQYHRDGSLRDRFRGGLQRHLHNYRYCNLRGHSDRQAPRNTGRHAHRYSRFGRARNGLGCSQYDSLCRPENSRWDRLPGSRRDNLRDCACGFSSGCFFLECMSREGDFVRAPAPQQGGPRRFCRSEQESGRQKPSRVRVRCLLRSGWGGNGGGAGCAQRPVSESAQN
jgi:hypothetical protein